MFPQEATKKSRFKQFEVAWKAFWEQDEQHDASEFDVHDAHAIKTARGAVVR